MGWNVMYMLSFCAVCFALSDWLSRFYQQFSSSRSSFIFIFDHFLIGTFCSLIHAEIDLCFALKPYWNLDEYCMWRSEFCRRAG